MSLSASLCHLEWQERKINLIDTPGDPGFQADTLASLRVVEGALIVGQRRQRRRGADDAPLGARRGARPLARRLREHARPRARRLLRGARAAPLAALRPLRRGPDPDRARARAQGRRRPLPHEGLPGPRAASARRARRDPGRDRRPGRGVPREARRRGRRDGRGDHGALPRRRGDLRRRAGGRAEERGRRGTSSSRSPAASPTKNLGTTGLLDLLVEGIPSPAKKPLGVDVDGGGAAAFVFKTVADPFAGRINVFRVLSGEIGGRLDARQLAHAGTRSASASCSSSRARTTSTAHEFGAGDIGAVAKLKETATGDLLLGVRHAGRVAAARLPASR